MTGPRPFDLGGSISLLFLLGMETVTRRFAPVVVTTGGLLPVLTHIGPGSGSRCITGGFDNISKEAVNVAVSWACINAAVLRALGGKKGRGSLFTSSQDLWISTTYPNLKKTGSSLGAAVALGIFCRLVDIPETDSRLLGASATLDLRGRLDIVGGLDEKAVEAEVRGLNLCVLSALDFKQLEEEDPPFSTVPEGGAREYAKTIFRGAETMLDLIEIVFRGAY